MSLDLYRTLSHCNEKQLRGDTLIEVMFATALFCLIAVISISMMNLGVASAENSLELVSARNEINAQAEALRFVHSSYISEKTLPLAGDLTATERQNGVAYQQYQPLWDTIVANAITPDQAKSSGLLELADTVTNTDTGGEDHAIGCERIYDTRGTGTSLLSRNNAFILNTRNLSSLTANGQINVGVSYISAKNDPAKFTAAPLNARLIFETADDLYQTSDSTSEFTDGGLIYDQLKLAEGIWVFAVSDGQGQPENSKYYDFYIEGCWTGPHTQTPITQDTVIRLYNPEGV